MSGLWVVIGILCAVILVLAFKLALMRKAARELEEEFADRLATETNVLIGISSRDRYMRQLAASLNGQLRKLRAERHRFQQGDLELKEAVTNISHDLRTPLTSIFGYLELLEREEKSEAVKRYLSMIENRADMLKQLTEELFRYSVIASTKESVPEWMDLRSALEQCLLSFYGAMGQRGIEPDIRITKERVERFLDPTAVNRILNNVIGNALKYSDGDFVAEMDEEGTIIFSNRAKELTPVMVGRLFDRFYTVETGRHSTGLGLSIAKLLTERMGGSIRANYREERLFVTICFPEEAAESGKS